MSRAFLVEMKIINAVVYTENHIFEKRDIYIDGERIAAMLSLGGEVFDAEGLYAVPAFVDVHLHGAKGADFSDGTEDAIKKIAAYEASRGVLALCPATVMMEKDRTKEVLSALSSYRCESGAGIIGVNLEGPFISPHRSGALDPDLAVPFSGELFGEFQAAACGMIKLLDLAPECMEEMDDIKKYAGEVNISVAHTNCDYETAAKAFALGANHLTHCFNAMPGIGHRAPGPVLAAAEAGAYAEIIADGIHLHPAVVRMAYKLFGDDKVVLISDSMRATAMPEGVYELGGQEVTVRGGKAVLAKDENVIAGSVTDLYSCFKKAVEMGVPLESAVRSASENPAKSIGAGKDYGTLSPGSYANILLLDRDLNIIKIINKGFMTDANTV